MAAEQISLDAEIQRALQNRKEEIVKGLVEGAVSSLQRDLGWKVAHATEEHIAKFIKEDVLPEVQKDLEARKAEIVASMLSGIDAALAKASDALVAKAAANLGNSWKMGELTKALFS